MNPKQILRDILAAVVHERAGNMKSPFMYIWSNKWKLLRERIDACLQTDQAASIDLGGKVGNLNAVYEAHPVPPLVEAEYNAWLLRLKKAIAELGVS